MLLTPKKSAHLALTLLTACHFGCAVGRPFSSVRKFDSPRIATTEVNAEASASIGDAENAIVATEIHRAEFIKLATHNAPITTVAEDFSAPPEMHVADVPPNSAARGMTLAEFEALALSSNPTIRQLAATTQKAAGFREQVSVRSNPIVGYQGAQIADRGTEQHTAFVQQEIVTGGKLALNRRVLNEALRAQLWELEAQKFRVSTDIQVKFYEALAAQQRVQLTKDFQTLASKGLELAQLRKKAISACCFASSTPFICILA